MTPSSANGILLIDKPKGMTSHDVVDRLRRLARIRRIGHAGTLDPLASGLLVTCLGPATRIAQFLVGLNKTYLGTARLGAISSTYDAEGRITAHERPLPPAPEPIQEAMAQQVGVILQLPPPYSAVKVRGRKLYEYARQGEIVPQKSRQVIVRRFELLHYEPPLVHFQAAVGSGAYIRSMIHDLGLALGCGAYLEALRRTRVGGFGIEQAIELGLLQEEPDLLPARLLSISEALVHLPRLTIQPQLEGVILNGGAFSTGDILECEGNLNPGQPVLVLDQSGRALSVARPDPPAEAQGETGVPSLIFRPLRVLTPQ